MEIVGSIYSPQYLYKYVHKGGDKAALTTVEHGGHGDERAPQRADEIKNFIDGRYIGPSEAIWRLMAFALHGNSPTVTRLQCHLPDHQPVTFDPEKDTTDDVLNSDRAHYTTLTEYFTACRTYPTQTQALTYDRMPEAFTWDKGNHRWTPRKRGFAYGRIYFVSPSAGERYYLRMLLCTVPQPTSFENLRTVNDTVHPTFKAACAAHGLLISDDKYEYCLSEASTMQTGRQLRRLFCIILLECIPQNPQKLWDKFWRAICSDCKFLLQNVGVIAEEDITACHVESYGLMLLDEQLQGGGKHLQDFHLCPPSQSIDIIGSPERRLILEELSFDRASLHDKVDELLPSLNGEQRAAFDIVTTAAIQKQARMFMMDGPGGTGKTHLENLILAEVRSKAMIVLAVASTGISAILLDNGRTSFSRFEIPLDPTSESVCGITRQSDVAELLRRASLSVWDKITMQDRYSVEAVDRLMRDIRQVDLPFGGCPMLFSGNWRQTLPVKVNGLRSEIINACLTASTLWPKIERLRMTTNMCVLNPTLSTEQVHKTLQFAKWLLDVGEGRLQLRDDRVQLPSHMLLPPGKEGIPTLIDFVYDSFDATRSLSSLRQYFTGRAILAPLNKDVDVLNGHLLHQFPGEQEVLRSADEAVEATGSGAANARTSDLPIEVLNSLSIPGIPLHELMLKIGCPTMLLRNIDPTAGLCNGTRLIITNISRRVLQALITTGPHSGERCFIPRIPLTTNANNTVPFQLRRLQFPIWLAFAMSINKSQGQSLQRVGLYLLQEVFAHGQLYVALSRATTYNSIYALLDDSEEGLQGLTKNIVYTEILQ